MDGFHYVIAHPDWDERVETGCSVNGTQIMERSQGIKYMKESAEQGRVVSHGGTVGLDTANHCNRADITHLFPSSEKYPLAGLTMRNSVLLPTYLWYPETAERSEGSSTAALKPVRYM